MATKRCLVCGQERSDEDFNDAAGDPRVFPLARVCETCEGQGFPTIEVKIAWHLERIADSLDHLVRNG